MSGPKPIVMTILIYITILIWYCQANKLVIGMDLKNYVYHRIFVAEVSGPEIQQE